MTVRRRPLLTSPPRRSWRLRAAASVALCAMLACFGSAAARAVDESEIDAGVNEILSRLPPDQAEAVFREIFDLGSATLVTESYAISPGSLRSLDSSGPENFFRFRPGVVHN